MKDHDEEDLRLSVAVQEERLKTMKAEYETGQAETRADIARYAAEGVVRDARHAEDVARYAAEAAARDAKHAEDAAKRDAKHAEENAKREAQHAATIRTIYAVVFGGVGLTVLSVGFIIGLSN